METKDKLTIISLVIASLSLLLTVSVTILNYSTNQKIQFIRTDDVFVANQFASFPMVQVQYSITSNGPSIKTTTIPKIKMTITRESDGMKYELFPSLNGIIYSNFNTLPINLTGNSSITQSLVFRVKQDGKNTDQLNSWANDIQKNMNNEDANIFKKAINCFSDSFILERPSLSQSLFRITKQSSSNDILNQEEYDKLFSIIELKKLLFFYENTYTINVDFYDSLGKVIYKDAFKFNINDSLQKRLQNRLNYFVLIEPTRI